MSVRSSSPLGSDCVWVRTHVRDEGLSVKSSVFAMRFWMDAVWTLGCERRRAQMTVSCSVYRSSINTYSDWLVVHSTLLINSWYAPADKQEVIHCLTSQLALKADGRWGAIKGTIHPKHSSCGQRARTGRQRRHLLPTTPWFYSPYCDVHSFINETVQN